MPWIENVSMKKAAEAIHHECGPNSMLIRIHDPAFMPLQLKRPDRFKEVHLFEFLDLEDRDDDMGEFAPTQEHATQLVQLLQHAFANRMNVVVHCHAGLCRSGAVAEIGIMMGFDEVHATRIPNTLLKGMMMKELGWSYE